MADASDSKSDVGDYVWVQVPSPANIRVMHQSITFYFIFFFIISLWYNTKGFYL